MKRKRDNKEVEITMLQSMLKFYCAKKHGSGKKICSKCEAILQHTIEQVDKCPYKGKKPSCRKCPIYCFHEEYKAQIKEVMRVAGLKTLLRHPRLTYSYYKRLTEI